jgi:Bacterial DNA-binding protein
MEKPAKAETVTLRDLAATLAESHDVPKKQTTAMLTGMVETITGHLKKGRRIRVSGLGILQVRASGADGPQSRYWRGHKDQSQQEGRLPGSQGTQGSGLVYF